MRERKWLLLHFVLFVRAIQRRASRGATIGGAMGRENGRRGNADEGIKCEVHEYRGREGGMGCDGKRTKERNRDKKGQSGRRGVGGGRSASASN